MIGLFLDYQLPCFGNFRSSILSRVRSSMISFVTCIGSDKLTTPIYILDSIRFGFAYHYCAIESCSFFINNNILLEQSVR